MFDHLFDPLLGADDERGGQVEPVLDVVMLRIDEDLDERRVHGPVGKRAESRSVNPRQPFHLEPRAARGGARALHMQIKVRAERPFAVQTLDQLLGPGGGCEERLPASLCWQLFQARQLLEYVDAVTG